MANTSWERTRPIFGSFSFGYWFLDKISHILRKESKELLEEAKRKVKEEIEKINYF
ncbi:MAG: hypothetical protein BWY53_00346 [Parcubacteria group bacterium ADurb.Bin326]|nr:MAG: hypothetical protein BWY53_00346 [Parcubacteria group bacterium ADurb.Bin326]